MLLQRLLWLSVVAVGAASAKSSASPALDLSETSEGALYASAGGPDGNGFGHAAAANSALVAVGSTGGQVQLYQRDAVEQVSSNASAPAVTWSALQTLASPEVSVGPLSDSFGQVLSLSESVLAVGAATDQTQGPQAGAVYLYSASELLSASSSSSSEPVVLLQQGSGLKPGPLGGANARFGTAVSVDDSFASALLVGAPGATNVEGVDNAGAAYLYSLDSTTETWMLDFELFGQSGYDGDAFGSSVALAGSSAIVGAPGHNSSKTQRKGLPPRVGAVYLYERVVVADSNAAALGQFTSQHLFPEEADSSHIQAGKLYFQPTRSRGTVRPDGSASTSLLDGDDGDAQQQEGDDDADDDASTGGGGGGGGVTLVEWTALTMLQPHDLTANAGFGQTVALSNSAAMVAATSTKTGEGVVYVFVKSLNNKIDSNGFDFTWKQSKVLSPTSGSAGAAQFGYSLALFEGTDSLSLSSSDGDGDSGDSRDDAAATRKLRSTGVSSKWRLHPPSGPPADPDEGDDGIVVQGTATARKSVVAFVGAPVVDDAAAAMDASGVYIFGTAAFSEYSLADQELDTVFGDVFSASSAVKWTLLDELLPRTRAGTNASTSSAFGACLAVQPASSDCSDVLLIGAELAGGPFSDSAGTVFTEVNLIDAAKNAIPRGGGSSSSSKSSIDYPGVIGLIGLAAIPSAAIAAVVLYLGYYRKIKSPNDGYQKAEILAGEGASCSAEEALESGGAVGSTLATSNSSRRSSRDSRDSSKRSSRRSSNRAPGLSHQELTERGLVPEYSPMHGGDGDVPNTDQAAYAVAAASTRAKISALLGGISAGIRRSLSTSGAASPLVAGGALYPDGDGDADSFANSRDSGDGSAFVTTSAAAAAAGASGAGAAAVTGHHLPPRHRKAGSSGYSSSNNGSVSSAKSKSSRNSSTVSDLLRRGQLPPSAGAPNAGASVDGGRPVGSNSSSNSSSVGRTASKDSSRSGSGAASSSRMAV